MKKLWLAMHRVSAWIALLILPWLCGTLIVGRYVGTPTRWELFGALMCARMILIDYETRTLRRKVDALTIMSVHSGARATLSLQLHATPESPEKSEVLASIAEGKL